MQQSEQQRLIFSCWARDLTLDETLKISGASRDAIVEEYSRADDEFDRWCRMWEKFSGRKE